MSFVVRYSAGVIAIVTVCLTAGSAEAQNLKALQGKVPPAGAIWLDSLDVNKIEQGWSAPRAGCSAECHPITIHGDGFVHGIGTYSVSEMWIDLKAAPRSSFPRSASMTTPTEKAASASRSGPTARSSPTRTSCAAGMNRSCSPSISRGVKRLLLRVNDGGDGTTTTAPTGPAESSSSAPGPRRRPETILPRGRRDRRWPTRIRRGRRCTARRSRRPRRAVPSCSSCPPAASRRFGSGPRICPRA